MARQSVRPRNARHSAQHLLLTTGAQLSGHVTTAAGSQLNIYDACKLKKQDARCIPSNRVPSQKRLFMCLSAWSNWALQYQLHWLPLPCRSNKVPETLSEASVA